VVTVTERPKAASRGSEDITKRLGAAAWGVFFVWVGYALLTGTPIGVGLVGVGLIALLAQAARLALALPVEGFWIAVGVGFVIGGLWNVYGLEVPLAPVLLVAVGVFLLGAALLRSRWGDDEDQQER
jgi:hypothetical protein